MAMGVDLIDGQRDLLCAGCLPKGETVALVKRDAPAEVRQCERALTVAAIGRADQLKEHVELGDRQELPLTEHPPGRGKVSAEHANLTDVRLRHDRLP